MQMIIIIYSSILLIIFLILFLLISILYKIHYSYELENGCILIKNSSSNKPNKYYYTDAPKLLAETEGTEGTGETGGTGGTE